MDKQDYIDHYTEQIARLREENSATLLQLGAMKRTDGGEFERYEALTQSIQRNNRVIEGHAGIIRGATMLDDEPKIETMKKLILDCQACLVNLRERNLIITGNDHIDEVDELIIRGQEYASDR